MNNEQLAQALRQAYQILSKAQTADSVDIDGLCIAIEEASGFVAEALDLVDNPPVTKTVKLDNIDAMSDELYDALDEAFKDELVRQGKDADVSWDLWHISADYETTAEYTGA